MNVVKEIIELRKIIEDARYKINTLADHYGRTVDSNEYYEKLIENTVKHYGISSEEIKGQSRKLDIVNCRFVIVYLLLENTLMTLKDIGLLLGKRDHSTIINARDKVKGYIDVKDYITLEMIDKIKIVS
tara:strand:- start:59 stop:445 length:387 start_codon:yes stop_codon:yes gene_type:complete